MTPSSGIDFRWLGRVPYDKALALQLDLAESRRAGHGGDTVLLLEHDPVYTIGRTPDKSSLGPLGHPALPHPVVEISRGGQATYHGPGQLVGYLILDLKNFGADLHRYLRAIEDALIAHAGSLSLAAERRENLTGMMVIRAFGNEPFEENRFNDANEEYTYTNRFVQRLMSLLMPAMMLIMNGVSLMIIWFGSQQVADGCSASFWPADANPC